MARWHGKFSVGVARAAQAYSETPGKWRSRETSKLRSCSASIQFVGEVRVRARIGDEDFEPAGFTVTLRHDAAPRKSLHQTLGSIGDRRAWRKSKGNSCAGAARATPSHPWVAVRVGSNATLDDCSNSSGSPRHPDVAATCRRHILGALSTPLVEAISEGMAHGERVDGAAPGTDGGGGVAVRDRASKRRSCSKRR